MSNPNELQENQERARTKEERQAIVASIKGAMGRVIDETIQPTDTDSLPELNVEYAVGEYQGSYYEFRRTQRNVGTDNFFETFEIERLLPTVEGSNHQVKLSYSFDEKNGLLIENTRHKRMSPQHTDVERRIYDRPTDLNDILELVERAVPVPEDETAAIFALHDKHSPLLVKEGVNGRSLKRGWLKRLTDKLS